MKRMLALALCTALAFASAAAAGQYSIKVAYTPGNLPATDSPDIMYAEVFKREVEKNSNGAIQVTLYPSGQLGSAAESVQGVMGGYIDMSIIDMTLLNNIYEPSQVLSTPGIFNSVEECNAILNNEWGAAYKKDFEAATRIHILNMHSKGFRNFTTANKELKLPADAKGVTFRVMESPVSIKMVEALGAKAVPMPGSEMYIAMRNGVVDGQENPVLNIIQDKTYEVQKYLVLDGHIAGIMAYIMNGKLYNSFSDELKTVVDAAAAQAMEEAVKVVETKNREGIQVLRDHGMVVYEPTPDEIRQWQEDAIFPATQAYVRGVLGDKVVDDLLGALKTFRGN